MNGKTFASVLSSILAASALFASARSAASEPKTPNVAGEAPALAPPDDACRAEPALELVRRIEWPGNHIFHTAFSPDSGLYLGGGDTGTVRIWEVATGNQLLELPVTVAWFSPDGKKLLGHKGDKIISVFDLNTGQEERNWEASDAFGSVAFSPDGKKVVTGHQDKAVRIWDFEKGTEIRKLEGHESWPGAVFSPDGKQGLSASVRQDRPALGRRDRQAAPDVRRLNRSGHQQTRTTVRGRAGVETRRVE